MKVPQKLGMHNACMLDVPTFDQPLDVMHHKPVTANAYGTVLANGIVCDGLQWCSTQVRSSS